jgi:hypothetical protein
MSVDAEALLNAAGLDWTYSLRKYPDFFLVRITAGFARQQAQTVVHTPQTDNEYHAEVVGQKSKPICSAFRDAAEWVKKPHDV